MYRRPACGPPVLSQARPTSASTERSGCAGMKSNPPTWGSVTKMGSPNPARPGRPAGDIAVSAVVGPGHSLERDEGADLAESGVRGAGGGHRAARVEHQ